MAVHLLVGLSLWPLRAQLADGQPLLPPHRARRDHWSPLWHQQDHTHLAAGDVNAFFFFRGTWHLMTQWEMEVPNTYGPKPNTLPIVGWGHSVSTDLLHFHRISPALVPGPPSTTMEGCYDGSVSFVHRGGDTSQPLIPMLMADGACGELPDLEHAPSKRPPGRGCAESFGNTSGGTLAYPANLNDPNLTVWEKDGPLHIEHCGVGGGPSAVWQPQPGIYNVMFRANGSATEARYETRDPALKNWTLADSKFIKDRIGCGGLWHTLPRSVDGTESLSRPYTHCYEDANGGRNGNGFTHFVLGVYNMSKQTFSDYTPSRLMDIGPGVMYGSFGDDPVRNRTLHISWLADGVDKRPGASRGPDPPAPGQPLSCDNSLTSLREVRFDPRVNHLVEVPIDEYLSLRGESINATSGQGVVLRPISAVPMPEANGLVGSDTLVLGGGNNVQDRALDFEVDIDIMKLGLRDSDRSFAFALGAQCEGLSMPQREGSEQRLVATTPSASSPTSGPDVATAIGCRDGVVFLLNVSGAKATLSLVFNGKVDNGPPTTILDSERILPVRLMTDVGSVELFAAHGRTVASTRVYSNSTNVVAAALAPGGSIALSRVAGWRIRPTET